MKKLTYASAQAGFTIVELMVATMVFSTIMLVITFGVMQFSRAYYRGITTSTLQNTARTTIDTITQGLQFSGTNVVSAGSPTTTYCLGGSQFDFVLHKQLSDTPTANQTQHALYLTPSASGGGCTATSFVNGTSKELLAPNMRIVNFTITPFATDPNLIAVSLRLAYGDDDLLCSPSVAGDCSSKTTSTHLTNPDLICKITTGSQFCAVSELSTIVQKRVQ